MSAPTSDGNTRHNHNPQHVFENFVIVAGGPDSEYLYQYQKLNATLGKTLPMFCYPFAKGHINPRDFHTFTFVLTDEEGLQQYGYGRHVRETRSGVMSLCFCLLSYLPVIEFFDQVLDVVMRLWEDNLSLVDVLLHTLYQGPLPHPGEMVTMTPRKGQQYVFHYPMTNDLPVLPANPYLLSLYSTLTPNALLVVYAALLYERRILLTSDDLSRLTACSHGLALLLYPLYWQHIFVPVLPSHLIDYITAPMPYLVGVHRSQWKVIDSLPLEEVVVVDLDSGVVHNWTNDLESFPVDVTAALIAQLKRSNTRLDDNLARIFLDLSLYLFGNYREFILPNKKQHGKGKDTLLVFDTKSFIASRDVELQPFLQSFCEQQMFHQFLDQRMDLMLRPTDQSKPVTSLEQITDQDGYVTLSDWWVERSIFDRMYDQGHRGTDAKQERLAVLQEKVVRKVIEGRQWLRPLQEKVQQKVREGLERGRSLKSLSPTSTRSSLDQSESSSLASPLAVTASEVKEPPINDPPIKQEPINDLLINFDDAAPPPSHGHVTSLIPDLQAVSLANGPARDLLSWDEALPTTGPAILKPQTRPPIPPKPQRPRPPVNQITPNKSHTRPPPIASRPTRLLQPLHPHVPMGRPHMTPSHGVNGSVPLSKGPGPALDSRPLRPLPPPHHHRPGPMTTVAKPVLSYQVGSDSTSRMNNRPPMADPTYNLNQLPGGTKSVPPPLPPRPFQSQWRVSQTSRGSR